CSRRESVSCAPSNQSTSSARSLPRTRWVEDREIAQRIAMVLPLLVQDHTEAMEHRAFADWVAWCIWSYPNLDEVVISEVIERLTNCLLTGASYLHDLLETR